MVGLPSQLGNQIIEDICKKSKKLDGCCCAQAAQALWSLQLPVNIRAHVSGMDFSQATYKSVFEAANQCYLSSCQVQVAAVATPLDETLPAFNNQNQPHAEVAPMGRGGGAPKKNRGGGNQSSGTARGDGRGGRGKNRGGKTSTRGPRHASQPPESCCDRHYTHGDQAWYCLAPLSCPWVNKVVAKWRSDKPGTKKNKLSYDDIFPKIGSIEIQKKIDFSAEHTPAERKLVFWSEPWLKPLVGVTVGQGGSEKCICKIFYRGHPEIGTPGTPWGSHGTKFFFWKNFSQKVIWVYVGRFRGYYG